MKTNNKVYVIDSFFKKNIINDKFILDFDNPSISFSKISKNEIENFNTLYFDNVYDVIQRKNNKFNFVNTIILSKHFNLDSNFDFLGVFPKLETIICYTHDLYDRFKDKYKNITVKYKEPEVNYC